MSSDDLFSLLLALLDAAGSLRPTYIGEFANRAAFPRRRRYPPLYAWIDGAGDLHLDADRPAIARLCIAESIRSGHPVNFGAPEVDQAVNRFVDLASHAAAETLRANAAALNNLKSARRRAAARWGVQA